MHQVVLLKGGDIIYKGKFYKNFKLTVENQYIESRKRKLKLIYLLKNELERGEVPFPRNYSIFRLKECY